MIAADERRVIAVAERSAVVAKIAQLAAVVTRAMRHSTLLAMMRPIAIEVAARPGLTLIVAALTHLAVMAIVSRPPSWYWLILPSLFIASGVVLSLMVDERRPRA